MRSKTRVTLVVWGTGDPGMLFESKGRADGKTAGIFMDSCNLGVASRMSEFWI